MRKRISEATPERVRARATQERVRLECVTLYVVGEEKKGKHARDTHTNTYTHKYIHTHKYPYEVLYCVFYTETTLKNG